MLSNVYTRSSMQKRGQFIDIDIYMLMTTNIDVNCQVKIMTRSNKWLLEIS